MSAEAVLGARPGVHDAGQTPAAAPPVPQAARSGWRRLVCAIDHSGKGAFALHGPWLRGGAPYAMAPGALVLACDVFADHRQVRLLRVRGGALEQVKTWELKTPMGKRVVDYTARRLAPDAARHTATALEAAPNRWDGYCAYCRNPVAAGAGVVARWDERARVVHRSGQCPPPPPRRTLFDGECERCGGWTAAGEGVLLDGRRAPGGPARRFLAHDGPCPRHPAPAPVRPNDFDGWCRDCGQFVPSGAGRWDRGIRHLGACPVPESYQPTWRVYRRRGEREVAAGEVFLARVVAGPHGGCPAPVDAPGFRVLAEDWFEFAAVALECARTGSGRQAVRVRAATWTEAEDILTGQMRLALDACPDAGGFRALFQAQLIGPAPSQAIRVRLGAPDYSRPWLAQITGRDRWFGYERRFLAARRDFTDADRRGTRGVVYGWTLKVNRLYQAQYPQGRGGVRRVFLRTTAQGDVREITAAQVEAFLNEAPEWLLLLGGGHPKPQSGASP